MSGLILYAMIRRMDDPSDVVGLRSLVGRNINMSEAAESHDGCPLVSVHNRMEAAHRSWHQALEGYFDPDTFLFGIQNCIPALRSVTFLLQKQKAFIPDFDNWYECWRKRMRADPVMRWLVEARNKIEKQGDLETHSKVQAEIIASYLDEFPPINVETNLFEAIQDHIKNIPDKVLNKQVLEHGTLKIQRRWVDSELPDQELLDSLAYAYGQLSILIDEAHDQMGFPHTEIVEIDENNDQVDTYIKDNLHGKLPCMVGCDEFRTVTMSLKSGDLYSIDTHSQKVDIVQLEEAATKYGEDIVSQKLEDPKNNEEIVEWLFDRARRIFEVDGYHNPMVIFIRKNKIINMLGVGFENRSEKYLMLRHIAKQVEKNGADTMIFINEIWRAKANPDEPFLYPADNPNRTEALALFGCSKNGDLFTRHAQIVRDGDNATLNETEKPDEVTPAELSMFAPVVKVWKSSSL